MFEKDGNYATYSWALTKLSQKSVRVNYRENPAF
jgi:hypothetical protein